MKKILIWILMVFLMNSFLYSQKVTIPQKIDFQAVARDVTGSLVDNQDISVRLTILKQPLPGTVVYEEEHLARTDQYGHFVLPIGAGNATRESFRDVDWTKGPHFVKIELDTKGGADYAEMGTLELMTVPYAFYAKHAENVNDADADPQNEIQQLGLQGEVLSIQGGNSIQLPDPSSENELQTLAVGENNVLSISRGNSVQLPGGSSRWKEKGQSVYLEDGKVGIGLNSVPHTLSLFGQNQAYMSFLTSATEIGLKNGFLVGLNRLSNTALIWNYERGEIRFGTDDKPRMLISTLGRVGIGTTSPSEKLTVNSSTSDVGLRINAGENQSAQLYLSETQSGKQYGFNWEYDGSGNLFLRSEGYGNDIDELMITGPAGISKIGVDRNISFHGQEGDQTALALTHEDYSGGLQMGIERGSPFIDFNGEQLVIPRRG